MDDNKDKSGREQQYDEFVSLLARHDNAIRRFVRYLLPSNEGVDDVLQETALECWRKFAEFQPSDQQNRSEEFVRWACVIARFKTLSWQRDQSRDRLVFRDSVVEALSQSAVDAVQEMDEERVAVATCLDELGNDQRRLVLSVHSPGQSIAGIAKETGQVARKLYSKVNVLRSLLLDCVRSKLAEENPHG